MIELTAPQSYSKCGFAGANPALEETTLHGIARQLDRNHLLGAQDRSQFDLSLAEEGLRQLERAATGPELTDYHVEAAIAWVHTSARRTEDTDWATIISLYDKLMAIRPSPEMSNSFLDVASWQGFVHHKGSKKRFGDSFDTFNG